MNTYDPLTMADHRTITANGLAFAFLEDGPVDGPLALCLHGFPDSARTWRFLLPELGRAGYHTVAPWLRGYAPTEVPADGRVGPGATVGDVNALHEALGGDDRAVLIGHDWGAVFSYAAAAAGPERWRRVVTMAVPPAGATAQGFMSYDQIKRSFYMFFFQSPLADFAVAGNDFEFIARLWGDWSPGYDATEDLVGVREALAKPENLQAAIGYYRAMFGTTPAAPEDGPALAALGQGPSQPTLYLHGRNDGCLGVEVAELGRDLLKGPGSRMEVVDGTGHFLQLEDPATVNRLVLDHVGPAA